MADGNRRKCKCCRTLFRPDPHNRHHQRYCSASACRAASTRPRRSAAEPGTRPNPVSLAAIDSADVVRRRFDVSLVAVKQHEVGTGVGQRDRHCAGPCLGRFR
jgi:hypothetical protein